MRITTLLRLPDGLYIATFNTMPDGITITIGFGPAKYPELGPFDTQTEVDFALRAWVADHEGSIIS